MSERLLAFLSLVLGATALLAVAIEGSTASATADPLLEVEFERGGLAYVADLSASAGGEVIGVGANGISRFDGVNWRLIRSLVGDREPVELHSVDLKHDAGWAVGSQCTAIRIEGSRAAPVALPWQCTLRDVSTTPTGQAWAVGWLQQEPERHQSLILHYDGRDWRPIVHPVAAAVVAVHMSSDESGWAVATQYELGKDALLRWNGIEWLKAESPSVRSRVNAIHGIGEDDVWAVGGVGVLESPSGAGTQLLMRFDGVAWSVVREHTGSELRSVHMSSPNEAWAVGEGGDIQRLTAGVWRQIHFGGSRVGLNAVTAVGPDDVWFAGDAQFLRYHGGVLYPWGGTERMTELDGLTSVSVLPSGEGWAVGPGGPMLMRRQGRWNEIPDVDNGNRLRKVLAVADNDVWASFDDAGPVGEVLHYDGAKWARVQVPTNFTVLDISATGGNDVWAVASTEEFEKLTGPDAEAHVLHFDGSEWRLACSMRGVSLWAVEMIKPDEGWAVGSKLVQLTDGSCIEHSLPSINGYPFVWDVAFLSQSEGWAVGAKYVLHYSGDSWSVEYFRFDFPQDRLHAVSTSDVGDVWIAGNITNWYRVDDKWTAFTLPTASTLPYAVNALAFAALEGEGAADVWLTGRFETIARVRLSVPLPTASTPSPEKPTPLPTLERREVDVIHLPLLLALGSE